MKLKKIASLALAGVMAVSMLTACNTASNGNTNGNDDVVVTPAPTSIVAAVNNGQSATNKVKINFTSDASLDAALTKAVKAVGDRYDATGLAVEMTRLTGYDYGMDAKFYSNEDDDFSVKVDPNTDAWSNINGKVIEGMVAMPLMNVMSDKAAAEKVAAEYINSIVAQLDDTTYVEGSNGTKAGQKYCDFSYTGTVSMVSSVENDGTVNYYFAFVITQTTAVKTLKATV